MELAVHGHVTLGQGGATISLSPLIQPPGPQATPPTPSMVAAWEIHPSRQPLSRDALTQAIILVQRQLSFLPAFAMEAGRIRPRTASKATFLKAKRGAASEESGPPKKRPALAEDRPLLALADENHSPPAPSTMKPEVSRTKSLS